jgi:hypothetical protein
MRESPDIHHFQAIAWSTSRKLKPSRCGRKATLQSARGRSCGTVVSIPPGNDSLVSGRPCCTWAMAQEVCTYHSSVRIICGSPEMRSGSGSTAADSMYW